MPEQLHLLSFALPLLGNHVTWPIDSMRLAGLFLVSSIAGLVQPSWRRALLVVPTIIVDGLAMETMLDVAPTGRMHLSAGLLADLFIATIFILTGAACGRAAGRWLWGHTAFSWSPDEVAR